MTTTRNIMAQVEAEYGSDRSDSWREDDMYVPFDPGEADSLCLEYDHDGFLCGTDWEDDDPQLEIYRDFEKANKENLGGHPVLAAGEPQSFASNRVPRRRRRIDLLEWYPSARRPGRVSSPMASSASSSALPGRESSLIVPDGMIVWIECNHPGRVYISDQAGYDWSDYNGCAPVEISWDIAVELISVGEGDGPWNLEICGPLPPEAVADMEVGR